MNTYLDGRKEPIRRLSRFIVFGLIVIMGVGVLTGFLGVGGGFLIVPALVMLVGLPMNVAVGTSLIVIAAVLTITALASWWAVRRDPDRIAHAGTVTDPRRDDDEPKD